jgi:hypothetical protein
MELTMRTIVVLVILLLAALIFAAIILGWGNEARYWFSSFIQPFQDLLLGK